MDIIHSASEEKNLWQEVGNQCLVCANALLKQETAPTAETAETVKKLVEIAIMIDLEDLQWTTQSRSCAAAFRGQPSEQPIGGN